MKIAIGWLLVAMSFAPWAVYSALPFLELPRYATALVATSAFAAGQFLFIVGLALLGGDAFARVRNHIRRAHGCKPQ